MYDLELRSSPQMFTDYVDLIIPRALLEILGARRTSTSCSVFSTKTETEALTSKCGPAYFQIFKNTFSRSSWLQQICAVLVTQRASLGRETKLRNNKYHFFLFVFFDVFFFFVFVDVFFLCLREIISSMWSGLKEGGSYFVPFFLNLLFLFLFLFSLKKWKKSLRPILKLELKPW